MTMKSLLECNKNSCARRMQNTETAEGFVPRPLKTGTISSTPDLSRTYTKKIPAQFLTASFFSVRCSPTSSLTKMEGQQLIAAFKQPIIHARIKCCSSSSCSQNVRVLANQPALLRTTRPSEIRPYEELINNWFP